MRLVAEDLPELSKTGGGEVAKTLSPPYPLCQLAYLASNNVVEPHLTIRERFCTRCMSLKNLVRQSLERYYFP